MRASSVSSALCKAWLDHSVDTAREVHTAQGRGDTVSMAQQSQGCASVPIHIGSWKSAMNRPHQTHSCFKQMKQIRALPATSAPGPREPTVKHWAAHPCVYVQGSGHYTPLLSHFPFTTWPIAQQEEQRCSAVASRSGYQVPAWASNISVQ